MPINDNLVLYYKMDETTGTTTVLNSGNVVYPGQLFNNTIPSMATVGQVNGAFEFDGVNDYVNFYGIAALPPSLAWGWNWSVSMWIRTTNNDGATKALLSHGDWIGGASFFLLTFDGGGYEDGVRAFLKQGGTNLNISGSSLDISDGNWHHIVVTRSIPTENSADTTTLSLYVDNVFIDSASGTGYSDIIDSEQEHVLGATVTTSRNRYLNAPAAFDDVRIYQDKVLTLAEIEELYEYEDPILCWNYTARYKNSRRVFQKRGGGSYPKELKVPSSVDKSTGQMLDEGKLIDPKNYNII